MRTLVVLFVCASAITCPLPGRDGGIGGCCFDCEYNLHCPGNGGCYKLNQPGCPTELCPAPNELSSTTPVTSTEVSSTTPVTSTVVPPVSTTPSGDPSGKTTYCDGASTPTKPKTPQQYNGIHWPNMCVSKKVAHFFGIGDWGGDSAGHTWDNPGKCGQRGGKVHDIDDYAQRYVADQMKKLAPEVNPDFVLNAGDNFYPGSINRPCGSTLSMDDPTAQFRTIFEDVYDGPLDDVPWFSVLGNHDYGGRAFAKGWDIQVLHTWFSKKWRLPAQYWSQIVEYDGFSIEVFNLDSAFMDAFPNGGDPNHNICQVRDGGASSCFGIDLENCVTEFGKVWAGSLDMLEKGLAASTAHWKIINTHFPGPSIAGQEKIKRLHEQYGIDLIFTGHTHYQASGLTNGMYWIISGGGGGVSSDAHPSQSGHDSAYGFVHFAADDLQFQIDFHSWAGFITYTSTITKRTKTEVV